MRNHKYLYTALACALFTTALVLIGSIIGYMNTRPVQLSELKKMTLEGDRIVIASKQYLDRNGRPPLQINDLYPNYLSATPSRAPEWSDWILLPKDPSGKDAREFAVCRKIVGNIRVFQTGYSRIVCYVDPAGRQDWYAAGNGVQSSDSKFLRKCPN